MLNREIDACKHFWQPEGAVASRWQHGHCLASCRYCEAWTVIDRGGIGPCHHSVGEHRGVQFLPGEPPLEKEFVPCTAGCSPWESVPDLGDWLVVACDDCKEVYSASVI